ncbi:MAG: mechanosensitive ion channel domain-containing protein, partial [Candidatus Deferrimicrobiaceae bacterium]
PATEEEIDRKIGQIQARLGELRLQPEPGQDNASGSGMTPDEAAEWRQLDLQRIYLLESREQALKDLKTLRHEAPSDPGRSGWKGFSGNPPYPLAALVNLYGHIYALRSEVDALEVQRAVREANLDTFLKARDATEKRLRQAEDLLKESAGKESAVRARRQRDLAKLRNEVNSEGALAEDVARLLAAEKIRSKRKELQSLEEQYRSAEVQSPLSREDLDRKLGELDARRKDQEKLLAAAIQEERSAKTALEKDRTGGPITAGPTERIRLETASSKIGIYQGSLKILNFEEALWQDRYRLGQGEDPGELREKRAEVDKALKQLGSWKEAFGKTAFSYAPLIESENGKLRSGTLSKEEEGSIRSRVAAYQERQILWGQVVQALNQVERVATRWKEDLEYRVEHVATAARARETGKTFLSVFGKLWNTELYVAEETTVIEGQKIVRPFSVTVGKVGKALIILLAGLWGTRTLGNLMKALAARRYGMTASRMNQIERKWDFFSFLLILAFSLAFVNIPLAVFAFFGGILAIGIGFGAQHLIGNFISSVILMFDRTISVEDIVEMEGQFGRVKSIGLRSSIIRRFDGVEVIVPNSQFMEQKVTNWTLSDQRVRYEIAVGAAYGSPTRETSGRILSVVREDERVLSSPEPVVIFESFGDNALMFRAFFWLVLDPERDNRVVCSDLRHRIAEALDGAGIVIAFPQRDVHLDAKGPIEVKVLPGDRGGLPES